MSDDFVEVPGASGNGDGGGASQGASGAASGAPDRNAVFEERLNKLGDAIQSLVSRDKKTEAEGKKSDLARRINAAIGEKQKEVDAAETALAAAYDEGDGIAIAKAQRKLSELTATVERMRAEGRTALNSYAAADKAGDAGDVDDSNLQAWRRQNKWFGTDAQLTAAARQIHKDIEEAGVIEVGSSEYFSALDQQMARKYPDRFKGSPGSAGQTGDGTPAPKGGLTRIPKDVIDGWRRMGINTDDPDTLKRMVGHRQTAVDKGILDPTPRYGRVIDR